MITRVAIRSTRRQISFGKTLLSKALLWYPLLVFRFFIFLFFIFHFFPFFLFSYCLFLKLVKPSSPLSMTMLYAAFASDLYSY